MIEGPSFAIRKGWTMKNSKRIYPILIVLALTLGMVLSMGGCAQTTQSGGPEQSSESTEQSSNEQATAEMDFHNPGEGYKLQQVVVLSRHNIRAPLSTVGSALDEATPYTWIDWTSNASELSMRGGALETMMG